MTREDLETRYESAAGWEGKIRPVYVGGMFFSNNPDTMEGWGVGMMRDKEHWALWVDGKGFVCGDDTMCCPVSPYPMTMTKDVAKRLCKTGISHWGNIFFVENKDYYEKLIEKAVKKFGYIQLDNPVEVKDMFFDKLTYTINAIDYVEGLRLCAFYFNDKIRSLNCCDTMSVVKVGRELLQTLKNKKIKL